MLSSFSGVAQENNPYNKYGIEHNQILDFAYNKFKKSNIEELKKTAGRDFVSMIVSDFYKSKRISIDTKVLNSFMDDFIFPPKPSPTFPDVKASVKYLEMSKQIFDTTKKGNLKGLIILVGQIESADIIQVDKKKLLINVSIGYNSLLYWEANYSKWMGLSTMSNKMAPPLAHIGAADVGGAIAGAIFAGVGAVPGAAAASIVQGCVELVDWLWP